MEARLQQLLDEAEIRRVHIRYCRGIDRMDWDLVRSCYHPDAIDRHGAYNGDVEGFIDWAAELLPTFESRSTSPATSMSRCTAMWRLRSTMRRQATAQNPTATSPRWIGW